MGSGSDINLVFNHLISDGTEDVVLLDSAETISADFTEATNEAQKIELRHDNDADSSSDGDGSSEIITNRVGDVGGTENKEETGNSRTRTHDALPVATDEGKLTIGTNELELRIEDLLRDKLSMKAFHDTSQADNDSKEVVCDRNSNMTNETYFSAIAKLCVENMMLRSKLDTTLRAASIAQASISHHPQGMTNLEFLTETGSSKTETFETFHVVYCARNRKNYYRDVPRMFQGDLFSDHLRGQQALPTNLFKFMDENIEIIFASTKNYRCACSGGPNHHGTVESRDGKLVANSPPAESQFVRIVLGKRIHNIIKSIMKSHTERFEGYSAADLLFCYQEPYRFFFHHNEILLDIATSSDINDSDRTCIQMLCHWLETDHRQDWDEAREMMSRGKINPKHYSKLFQPDELYVGHPSLDDPEVLDAFKSQLYPWKDYQDIHADTYGWTFNGRFRKHPSRVPLRLFPKPGISSQTEVDITSLPRYPIRFAEPGTKQKLVARGHKFWNCRTRSLVCYRESEEAPMVGQAEKRFMVDYAMFRRIHPDKRIFKDATDDLGEEAMNKTEPPDDDFLAMLPPYIFGFDIDSKKWRSIRVDRTTAVTWNKDAFNRLVIAPDTKEMLLAAITSHAANAGPATDLIAGKGQGLLILLHGGPGTGKTLTAESIAEAQEKPLYRVTCGDIGMEPEAVEVYLKSVLQIGRAWECVVLLDEADVFLEARTVPNQKQNAIVSVFLRMLEYYNGILILTSNRVATFDEAFKSRIHLPIRYPDLDEDQRVKIWRNFIEVLKRSKERVDFADLELNVPHLAQHTMNGRQIRNTLQMARYLARFRKQMMVYKHVQDAVAAVLKFDGYLEEFLGPDDVWARQERLR